MNKSRENDIFLIHAGHKTWPGCHQRWSGCHGRASLAMHACDARPSGWPRAHGCRSARAPLPGPRAQPRAWQLCCDTWCRRFSISWTFQVPALPARAQPWLLCCCVVPHNHADLDPHEGRSRLKEGTATGIYTLCPSVSFLFNTSSSHFPAEYYRTFLNYA
jgi:hypothetical protein